MIYKCKTRSRQKFPPLLIIAQLAVLSVKKIPLS